MSARQATSTVHIYKGRWCVIADQDPNSQPYNLLPVTSCSLTHCTSCNLTGIHHCIIINLCDFSLGFYSHMVFQLSSSKRKTLSQMSSGLDIVLRLQIESGKNTVIFLRTLLPESRRQTQKHNHNTTWQMRGQSQLRG